MSLGLCFATPGISTIRAVLDNLRRSFMVCTLILTHLDEIQKTTSIFFEWKMTQTFLKREDEYRRQLQYFF
jgi:hypothetical protein